MADYRNWGQGDTHFAHYVRAMAAPIYGFARTTRRLRNAMFYVLRGDFVGLRKRVQVLRQDRALAARLNAGKPSCWGVMATQHTLFIANLISKRLKEHGFQVSVMTDAPLRFDKDMYVVICPQMFKRLPPGEVRIAFQMEQSVSSRWFTDDYLKSLNSSFAVLEYSLKNIEFLSGKGIRYPLVHYMPIGALPGYSIGDAGVSGEKWWDVLFYGDAKSSPRRRRMLEALGKNFSVRICSEVFGVDMAQEIRRARVVVNIHYYENALLEMPRIQECLSLGVPVVSEAAVDQEDYPELDGAVTFFREGSEQEMLRAVRVALAKGIDSKGIISATERSAARFQFMFDRFLVAMNFIDPTRLLSDNLPLPSNLTQVALSLPETIERRLAYNASAPPGFIVFDGVRHRPGWVGCGLSYKSLARHALNNGVRRLTVIEDDVMLSDDFDERMQIIGEYLDSKDGEWDIFSGLIAILHEDVRVTGVEVYRGMRFVMIDKMTSMVCNIYNESALRCMMRWDSNNIDDQTNTIDRFLEAQNDLMVVVALPFLVGHREDMHSTLWGFQNSQYGSLIEASEKALIRLADVA